MSQVNISIVSGNRAEFGQLLPLLLRIQDDDYFKLDFVVTGAHLSKSGGNTLSEIEKYPLQISKCIPIPNISNNSPSGIGNQIGEIIQLFTAYYSYKRPDILIVIGDRYEMFGVGIAACVLKIPMVHLCGGSTTMGALDEVFRHSLTKMSQFHFVTCEKYRRRVIQLGEQPERVFNVGSLAIENCCNVEKLSEQEIRTYIGLMPNEKYCIVTYHPVTLAAEDGRRDIEELIQAMDSFQQFSYVITLSNVDAGGEYINDMWKMVAKTRPNYHVVSSLGVKRYLSALCYAEMMIGNSSSGTTEGPAMHVPTVDIGDRQKGRFFAESIVHCEANRDDIIKAISKAGSQEFKEIAKKAKNPFGDGTTSKKMIELLKKITKEKIDIKKKFYDLGDYV